MIQETTLKNAWAFFYCTITLRHVLGVFHYYQYTLFLLKQWPYLQRVEQVVRDKNYILAPCLCRCLSLFLFCLLFFFFPLLPFSFLPEQKDTYEPHNLVVHPLFSFPPTLQDHQLVKIHLAG